MSDLPPPQSGAAGSTPAPPPPPPSGTGAPNRGPLGKQRSIALVVLLTIVTFGIWMLVWSFQTGNDLRNHTREGLGGAVYLVITLFVSPVTMFLMANEVEKMYLAQRRQPPITTLWGLWFLLPLIGNLIWYVKIQRSINDYWASMGATDSPGI